LSTHPNPTRSCDAHKKKKKNWKKLNVIPETPIQRSSLPSPRNQWISRLREKWERRLRWRHHPVLL
jgi:hypothetical protein